MLWLLAGVSLTVKLHGMLLGITFVSAAQLSHVQSSNMLLHQDSVWWMPFMQAGPLQCMQAYPAVGCGRGVMRAVKQPFQSSSRRPRC